MTNNDGVLDLVCLDGKKNLLEFVGFFLTQKLKTGRVRYTLKFLKRIYTIRGRKVDCRNLEGLIADLNGDGLDDLAFLVHDRLPIYRQIIAQLNENIGAW